MTPPDNRDRNVAALAILVGVLVLLALVANAILLIREPAPASSDELNGFVSCIQNVAFSSPEVLAEAKADTVGQGQPVAVPFCDRLAELVRADAVTSTTAGQ